MKISKVLTLVAFLMLESKAISIESECAPCCNAQIGSGIQIDAEISIESECAPCCNAQVGSGVEIDAEDDA